MKEFDIEKAKAGAPVHTVDDYMNVRILCFDVDNSDYPIVAALEVAEGETEVRRYTLKGEYAMGCSRPLDLTTKIRHEGWVNIYRTVDASVTPHVYGPVWPDEASANENAKASTTFIDTTPATHVATVKIEWEE